MKKISDYYKSKSSNETFRVLKVVDTFTVLKSDSKVILTQALRELYTPTYPLQSINPT